MNSALQVLAEFEASTADGFPLGQQGGEVLETLERITKLVEEAKAFYKAQLANTLWRRSVYPSVSIRPSLGREFGDSTGPGSQPVSIAKSRILPLLR